MGLADRDYMRARYRRLSRTSARGAADGGFTSPYLVIGLVVLAAFLVGFGDRLANLGLTREPFPESGSVSVAPDVDAGGGRATFTIVGANLDAAVQLFSAETDRHVMTIYIARGAKRSVPVPFGTYRLRIATGQVWYGRENFFGRATEYRRAVELMAFTPTLGHVLYVAHPFGDMETERESQLEHGIRAR